METSPTIEETLFREEAERYQEEQKRTKSAGLRDGLLFVGVSAISLTIITLIRILSGGLPEAIVLLVVPVMVIMFVVGLYRITISLVRSEKQVTCPKCGTVHEIFRNERLYVCTDCWTLLHMGEDGEAPIRFLICAYCGNRAAVADDHGAFVCPNCGVTRSSSNKAVDWKFTPCLNCQEVVPQEALYCVHCGQVLNPLPTYDKDWEIGKDAHGHFQFARMLLATFPTSEAALETRFRTDNPRSGKHQWPDTFREMPPMQTLGRAQRSLEEALREPELRPLVGGLLPEIDVLYARLLVLEIKMILWAEGPDNLPLVVRADHDKGTCLDIFHKGPHILARKRIEHILGPESLQAIGSIGPWRDQSLVNTRMRFAKDYKGETASSEELSSYTGLITEAKRFAEWAKRNGYSADLLDTILELEEKSAARRRDGLPAPAAPSVADKREPLEAGRAATGEAAPASSASITSEMPRSTPDPAKPKSKWGCVLATCGSFTLAVGLMLVAMIGSYLLDPDSVGDAPAVVIARTAICVLPICLFGFALLAIGIRRLHGQRKQPTAAQHGGYRTKTEKEAWAQARVGVEFITEGNYPGALAVSERALAKSPRCKEAWVVKGGALALLNRSKEALACYEQALAIDPSYEEASTQKEMLLQSL
jgi:hypothetical protein